jgi:hypothetical protein
MSKSKFPAIIIALIALIPLSQIFHLTQAVTAQDLFNREPEPERAVAQDEPVVVRPRQPAPQIQRFQLPEDLEERPGQSVVVRDRYAGWEQAGPSDNGRRLSRDLRANWIMIDINGSFRGRVVPADDASLENMNVYLMNLGRPVRESKVEADGYFEFHNVDDGTYSLVGWGDNAFFAFGLIVLDYEEAFLNQVTNNIRVLAFQNRTTINTDWIQFFSPKVSFRVFGRHEYGEGDEDPIRLYGSLGLSRNLPAALPATSLDARSVTRTASGGVLGRVHQINSLGGRPIDLRNTRVIMMQGDQVVAATDADNYGVFFFPQIPVGQYGLAAVGADGMGLIGVDVIDAPLAVNEAGEVNRDSDPFPVDFTLVSPETVGWLNNYAGELAYRRNLIASQKRRTMQEQGICLDCEGTGCMNCGGSGLCTSRCQTFEDWMANCPGQHERTKLGSGYILSEGSKDLRRFVGRGNQLFEDAFYGSHGNFGGTGNYSQSAPGTNYFNNGYQGGMNYQTPGTMPNQWAPAFNQPAPGFPPNSP